MLSVYPSTKIVPVRPARRTCAATPAIAVLALAESVELLKPKARSDRSVTLGLRVGCVVGLLGWLVGWLLGWLLGWVEGDTLADGVGVLRTDGDGVGAGSALGVAVRP